ncbi:MAG: hypothetical protein AAGC46_07415 [Solirubrobacteraceae bacterium]|nr:hypothetical protein [Patulibacter sp.]
MADDRVAVRRLRSWMVLLVWTAAITCLVIGVSRFEPPAGDRLGIEGGYSTVTVGAPAYAAVFTLGAPSRTGVALGIAITVLGSAALAIGIIRRRRARRAARMGLLVLAAGLVWLVVAAARMPRSIHDLDPGITVDGRTAIRLHVPGRGWTDTGTVLALLAGLGLMRLRFREPVLAAAGS